jgi:glucose/mannose transport system substrate-binding protein
MHHLKTAALCAGIFAAGVSFASAQDSSKDLEVLHYWTSGSEAKAVDVLRQKFDKEGYHWKDSAIAGGGGENAMTVLKSRAVAGDPPGAVQMRGPAVFDWADQGALDEIDSVAGDWKKELPPAINDTLVYKGHYYAAPHWVHRTNWLWINKHVLDDVGAQVPTTWDEFFKVADAMKAKGYIAIAHGDDTYQDGYMFEPIVESMGIDFYKKAILDRDPSALNSPTMVKVFDILRKEKAYFDDAIHGRSWNQSAHLVIDGKAGMFFMGDWAKGEFTNAGKAPDEDFVCAAAPGTNGMFTFIADTMVFFKQHGQPASEEQLALAKLIMSPDYQEQAAKFKGSIPALTTASMQGFDSCAQKSASDMKSASASDQLVPSMNQASPEATLGAIRDVVAQFLNSDQDSEAAAKQLADAVQAAE